MQYRSQLSADVEEWLELSSVDFDAFKQASVGFAALHHIEDTYDVMIGNYLDFEETISSLAVRQLANRHPLGQVDYFDPARRVCHRRLANFLSSAKAFDDQSRAAVSRISGKPSADFSWLNDAFSEEYDRALGYRVMCELRNHAQHAGLAVTGVSFGARSLALETNDNRIGSFAQPFVHMDELRRSRKFKPKVLAELEPAYRYTPDPEEHSFPVLPFVREYMAGLSNVLVGIRSRYEDREAAWAVSFEHGFAALSGTPGFNGWRGFEILALDGNRTTERLWLSTGTMQRIASLRTYNTSLKSLTRRIIIQ
ncbi:MAG: hypothetical protein V4820_12105 [Pseudomonadota bacterium]